MYFVFDSPEVHPRIDPAEKEYIIKSLGSSVFREKDKHEKREIPWKAILTSKCTWVTVIADLGNVWGLFTILTQSPTYFRFIHGWSIQMVGVLSGFPHLMRVLFSFVFSSIGDYLLTGSKMTRENVRKLATLFRKFHENILMFWIFFYFSNVFRFGAKWSCVSRTCLF
jgi:hypothetical protein